MEFSCKGNASIAVESLDFQNISIIQVDAKCLCYSTFLEKELCSNSSRIFGFSRWRSRTGRLTQQWQPHFIQRPQNFCTSFFIIKLGTWLQDPLDYMPPSSSSSSSSTSSSSTSPSSSSSSPSPSSSSSSSSSSLWPQFRG